MYVSRYLERDGVETCRYVQTLRRKTLSASLGLKDEERVLVENLCRLLPAYIELRLTRL